MFAPLWFFGDQKWENMVETFSRTMHKTMSAIYMAQNAALVIGRSQIETRWGTSAVFQATFEFFDFCTEENPSRAQNSMDDA